MKFYLILFLAITPYSLYAQKQGQPLIDSLLRELLIAKEDTNKVKLFGQLSFTYSNINPDEGIRLGQKAIDLSSKLSWEKGIAIAMLDLGVNHEAKSDHVKALEYYHNALIRYERIGDKSSISRILASTALVYLAQSNYPKALEYDFKALTINEELDKRKSCAMILENIGTIYFEQKEYVKTTEYYTQALTIYNDLGDKESVAKNLGNSGIVLAARGEYAEAVKQQLKALKIHRELGKINSIQINLTNIGDDYDHLKDYPNALKYQLKALQMSEELGNKNSIAINLGNIGETYFNMAKDSATTVSSKKLVDEGKEANLHHAIRYLGKAVSICTEIKFFGPLVEFSQYLSEAYFLSADYKKAFESLKQYTVTKDSVFSVQNKTQITNLEEERVDELRKKEMLIKDEQIQINALTISRKQTQQELSIACIILLLVVVGIVLKSLYVYRRSNYALVKEEKMHLLLIEEQIDRLKKQTSVLKEISHMQAHDVRGPIATILGLVRIFNFENFSDPTNKIVIEGIASITEKLDTAVKDVIKKENTFNPIC